MSGLFFGLHQESRYPMTSGHSDARSLCSPYLPDLAPVDFHLFSKLKMELKDYCFSTVAKIWKQVTEAP